MELAKSMVVEDTYRSANQGLPLRFLLKTQHQIALSGSSYDGQTGRDFKSAVVGGARLNPSQITLSFIPLAPDHFLLHRLDLSER